MTGFERTVTAGVVVLIVVAGALWVFWPAPQWTVRVEADTAEALPWQTIDLRARVAPKDGPKGPVTWSWISDGRPSGGKGAALEWRSGIEGAHTVEVTASTANGVAHRARIVLTILRRAYLSEDGKKHEPPPEEATPTSGGSALSFGIEDVWVEKSEICQGESTRVRLTPFDTGGEEMWRRPLLNNEQSWEVTFTAPTLPPGLHRIPVVLNDGRSASSEPKSVRTSVYVTIKDCVAPYPMFVQNRPIPPHESYMGFTVLLVKGQEWKDQMTRRGLADRVVDPRAPAKSFVWDFGDGVTATTSDPQINHRYPDQADRPNERATTYKVKVDALGERGEKMATAHSTVTLPNLLRVLARENKTLQLVSTTAPGPAHRGENGQWMAVRLRNIHPTETAQLSGLKARFVSCDGRDATEQSFDVPSVLDQTSVPPGGVVSGRFALSDRDIGQACAVAVEVLGTSSPGGLRVTGFFSLDTGKQIGELVPDDESAIIKKARALLGDASVVSVDDLRRLEDEGKIPRVSLGRDAH